MRFTFIPGKSPSSIDCGPELTVPVSRVEELRKFYHTISSDERSAVVLKPTNQQFGLTFYAAPFTSTPAHFSSSVNVAA